MVEGNHIQQLAEMSIRPTIKGMVFETAEEKFKECLRQARKVLLKSQGEGGEHRSVQVAIYLVDFGTLEKDGLVSEDLDKRLRRMSQLMWENRYQCDFETLSKYDAEVARWWKEAVEG